MRKTVCLVLALELWSLPALAQQPIQESAKTAAAAAARDEGAPSPSGAGHRSRFWTGAVLGVAGGTAIILGTTVSKSADTTSGNTPKGAYQNCVALQSNPVYRGNQCDDLRGPNNAVLYGGIAAAAAGISLMLMGSSMSAIEFGPRAVRFRHHVKF